MRLVVEALEDILKPKSEKRIKKTIEDELSKFQEDKSTDFYSKLKEISNIFYALNDEDKPEIREKILEIISENIEDNPENFIDQTNKISHLIEKIGISSSQESKLKNQITELIKKKLLFYLDNSNYQNNYYYITGFLKQYERILYLINIFKIDTLKYKKMIEKITEKIFNKNIEILDITNEDDQIDFLKKCDEIVEILEKFEIDKYKFIPWIKKTINNSINLEITSDFSKIFIFEKLKRIMKHVQYLDDQTKEISILISNFYSYLTKNLGPSYKIGRMESGQTHNIIPIYKNSEKVLEIKFNSIDQKICLYNNNTKSSNIILFRNYSKNEIYNPEFEYDPKFSLMDLAKKLIEIISKFPIYKIKYNK
jgi:hypothetical protein